MHHAHQDVGGQHRGAAAGEEGKGDAHHGEDSQAHTHVLQGLGDEDARYAHGYEHAVVVAGLSADPQHPHDQGHQGGDDQ